ncbi:hypothetical protein [uncultured Tenacibaculum sp.]|uniref:hypothetical protein n=1 Tax=uncultured Tenacibaculum sp. TaxID=174713 RepID=UPI002623357C|nr:hypothetical protein [uncultured Tenacibaculum sp.]
MEELLKVLKELNSTFESIVKPVTETIQKLEKLDEGVKEITKNTDNYQKNLDKIKSGFKDIQNAAKQTQNIFSGVGEKIAFVFSPVTSIIGKVGDKISDKITPKIDALKNRVSSLTNVFTKNFSRVSEAIKSISENIKGSYIKSINTIKNALNKIGILPIFKNLSSGISKIFGGSIGIISDKITKLKQKLKAIKIPKVKLTDLKKGFETASEYVKKFVNAFGDQKKLKALNELYNSKVGKITKDLNARFKAALGPIANKIIDFATTIVNGFDKLYKAADPIINAIVNLSRVIGDFIISLFGIQNSTEAATAVIDTFKTVIDFLIKPISYLALGLKIVFEALKPIAPIIGVITGAWIVWNAVMAANPITWIIIGIIALISAIAIIIKYTKGWATAWQGFKDILSAVWNQLKENFSFFIDSIVYGFQKAWYNVLDFGQRTIQYVKNVGNAIKLAWDGNFSGAKAALNQKITTEAEIKLNEIEENRKKRIGQFNQNTSKNALQLMEGVGKMKSLTFDKKAFNSDIAKIQKGFKLPKAQTKKNDTPVNTPDQGIANITDGGKKQTHINVHFDRLVENMVIQSENLKEGTNDMEDMLITSLLRVLNSVNHMQTNNS